MTHTERRRRRRVIRAAVLEARLRALATGRAPAAAWSGQQHVPVTVDADAQLSPPGRTDAD